MLFTSLSRARLATAARIAAAAAGLTGAGLAVLWLPATSVRAAEPLAFTIPEEDGYGLADCMKSGSACGQAMATSWCEAHGHPHAAAYGLTDDLTGTTRGPATGPVMGGAVIIRCDDQTPVTIR